LQDKQQPEWYYQQPSYLKPQPKRTPLPEIKGNQRIALIGKTQSGKSTYARYILKKASEAGWRIVIVDPKKDWMGKFGERRKYGEKSDKFRGTVDSPILINPTQFDPTLRVMIVEPVSWNPDMDVLFTKILAVGRTIIYVDEVTQLVTGTWAPKMFLIAYTQGAAAGVGVWAGMQRPKGIPGVMLDQAEVWIVFRVKRYEDRVLIASFIPQSYNLLDRPLPVRYFIFYEDTMDTPVLCAPLNEKEVRIAVA
jgi:hypothetical protein